MNIKAFTMSILIALCSQNSALLFIFTTLVCSFSCFQLLYMTLTIDKMDGHDLINTAHCEYQPKKTKVTRY